MAYGSGPYGSGPYGLSTFQPVIPVEDGGALGGLVKDPGQVQFGPMLLGSGTPAGWVELVGWRDLPNAQIADATRPQAHGAYPGSVYGDAQAVTFTYLLRGTPEAKAAAVATIERHAPMDGVPRPLTVDDGDGPWFRLARVIGRTVPQGVHWLHTPAQCSVQFLCADPRAYRTVARTATVQLPTSQGGLAYPLAYPLDYGTSTSGSTDALNAGAASTPPVVQFVGPLTDPMLSSGSGWRLGFKLALADGETLTVDTLQGTALLNGKADRLYAITRDSTPVERCLLAPDTARLSLQAAAGTGHALVTWRDARL